MSDQYAHDRTAKQPIVWVCHNPECMERGERFEFQSDYPTCPKCGNEEPPVVSLRGLIHLLVPDKDGLIRGKYSFYRLACDRERSHLATATNQEGASNLTVAVNCPTCLQWMDDHNVPKTLMRPIMPQELR